MRKIYALILVIGLVTITFNQIQTNIITADGPISIFGYSENGVSETNIENRIVGVWGEATGGDGVADFIMAQFRAVDGYGDYVGRVTAGLYEYVDVDSGFAGDLLAQTEVREVTVVEGSTEWLRFDFTGMQPSIVNGVKYYCVVSAEVASGNLKLMAKNTQNYGMYQVESYNDVLPSPLTGEITSGYRRSIYCSYTVTPENDPPVISNPTPFDGASDVSVSLSQLIFFINDPDGDPMDYSVETSPDIGGKTGFGVNEGLVVVDVSDLDYDTTYSWDVEVTDPAGSGELISETFSFTTEIEPDYWWDYDWMYRKVLVIDHTMVAGDLFNFPVLVRLSSDTNLASHAQVDGDDIIFIDTFGNKLNHEIELFNDDSGELIAWVNIPYLPSSIDTVLYLYYGNNLCNNQENVEDTWDSNFFAVHHFNEESGEHLDYILYQNNSI